VITSRNPTANELMERSRASSWSMKEQTWVAIRHQVGKNEQLCHCNGWWAWKSSNSNISTWIGTAWESSWVKTRLDKHLHTEEDRFHSVLCSTVCNCTGTDTEEPTVHLELSR
jgi:hypothetical protein